MLLWNANRVRKILSREVEINIKILNITYIKEIENHLKNNMHVDLFPNTYKLLFLYK